MLNLLRHYNIFITDTLCYDQPEGKMLTTWLGCQGVPEIKLGLHT